MSSLLLMLRLLMLLEVSGSSSITGTRGTDLLPLDLLTSVLGRAPPYRPVPGVHVKRAGGVRGVHFSSPRPSLSFPSSQLLPDCEIFPEHFSIVVTLKVTHVAQKRNEYIFSLIGPNAEERGEGKGGGAKGHQRRSLAGEDGGSRKTKDLKSSGERGRVILGLRFSKKSLHFLFRDHEGLTVHWVFKDAQNARFADNKWHTLVLSVGGERARLTVDCRAQLDIFPSRPFPSDLNIQGSRFHIGNRGRWKGLFSGLLRQLVLVPGSDATHQVCPSLDSQPATLSVPPLLLDRPVKGRRPGDRRSASLGKEERVSVGLQPTCSELLRGQLWFNPLRKGLYLCDGSSWTTVLEDRKRLDYVSEQQVLSTSSETHDIEVFQVPGVGLMAAMAHRSSSSGSAVYLWSQDRFRLFQNISTHQALAWRHFSIGKKVFLVVSNSGGGTQDNKDSETEFSVIYKWSNKRKQFVQFQSLQTYCARDWEAFTINRQTYIAVANHRRGNNNHTINSVIYQWNSITKSFEVHQLLPTSGAYDWEFFTVGPYHFLVVANAFDGLTTSVDSVIYVWVNGRFEVFQKIKTFCATDWEMFQIGSRVFLVVANGHRLHGNEPSRYNINSTIYELDVKGQMFVRFQDIVTYSALDWEFFSLGGDHFLIVANSFDGESYSLNSILYRWQGYEGFVPAHSLPTIGCSDWEFFSSAGESFLIYSSAKAPLSKVFKLQTY